MGSREFGMGEPDSEKVKLIYSGIPREKVEETVQVNVFPEEMRSLQLARPDSQDAVAFRVRSPTG